MKALLVCEYQQAKLLESTYELLAFAEQLGAEKTMLLIGTEAQAPKFNGKVYLADAGKYGEYNPDMHKRLVLDVAQKEGCDYIVFLHSCFGWDLAPRVAVALQSAQISEIVAVVFRGPRLQRQTAQAPETEDGAGGPDHPGRRLQLP
jgi:electron transfer flavoprotein alpha subunit